MRTSFLVVLLGVLCSCAPMISKREFAPKMYAEHPVSIVVLPAINQSTAADAKEFYATTVAEPLTNCGYYVFPIEVVNDVLKQEGLFDTESFLTVPVRKFRDYFDADAVLYVTIIEWNTSYYITGGNVRVKIACELKSTTTGETLWFYDDVVIVDTSVQGSGGGWAGLLANAIATAVNTAAQDYVPIARKVNAMVFVAMPYGKYHPSFMKDGGINIRKKSAAPKH